MSLAVRARRAFYRAGGPYRRARLAEALGSRRWSRPALHDMDERLDALLDLDGGVFLEAGAHDGFTQSNTYYLERFRGLSGVLVEAVPELHAKAAGRRTRAHVVRCCLVGPEAEGKTVELHFGDLMSTATAGGEHAAGGLANAGLRGYTVTAPGRTLDSVLRDAGVDRLDLMVLDLEGAERDALRGMDFDRVGCGLLVVEMLDLPRDRPDFDRLLEPWFVPAGQLSPDDALYRQRG